MDLFPFRNEWNRSPEESGLLSKSMAKTNWIFAPGEEKSDEAIQEAALTKSRRNHRLGPSE
jgi:hypothetical protein